MAESSFPEPGQFTRREAITTLAAGVVVASTGPFIHAADKSGTENPIIGEGEHRYECHHGWGTPPESVKWLNTHGVTIDCDGLIYVKHQSGGPVPMDTIVVFDPEGKAVRSFGKEYHGGGHGIDLRNDGGEEFLYLSDTHNRQVVKTSKTGRSSGNSLIRPSRVSTRMRVAIVRPMLLSRRMAGSTSPMDMDLITSTSTTRMQSGSAPGEERARNPARCKRRTESGSITDPAGNPLSWWPIARTALSVFLARGEIHRVCRRSAFPRSLRHSGRNPARSRFTRSGHAPRQGQ